MIQALFLEKNRALTRGVIISPPPLGPRSISGHLFCSSPNPAQTVTVAMNESTRLIKIEDPQECRVIERNALLGHHTRIDYLPVDGLRKRYITKQKVVLRVGEALVT